MAKQFEFFPVDPATKPAGWKPAKILKPGWHKRAVAAERRREHPACLQKREYNSDVKPLEYAEWLIKRDGIDVRACAREAVAAYNADLPMVPTTTWRGKASTYSTERAKPICLETFTMGRVLVWAASETGQMRPCSVLWMVTGARHLVGFTLELPHWNWEPSCVETVDAGDDTPGGSDDSDDAPAPVLDPVAEPETPIACDGAPADAAPESVDPVPTPSPTPADPAPTCIWAGLSSINQFAIPGAPCDALEPPVGIQGAPEAIGGRDPLSVIGTVPTRPNWEAILSDRDPIYLGEGLVRFPLSRGLIAIADEADAPLLIGRIWCAAPNQAKTTFYAVTGDGLRMHRIVARAKAGDFTNHRDRDGLNNRRANLRNRDSSVVNVIRQDVRVKLPRGVKRSRNGSFEARIVRKDGYVHLGTFASAQEAGAVYAAAMKSLYGEWFEPTPPETITTPPAA